jgi:DNA-binding NtrC family response regulator
MTHPASTDPPDLETAILRRTAARQALADADRAVLLAALAQTGGNRTRAAELLGMPARTVFRHVAALGADAPPPPANGTMTRMS